jgi:hypothetical protein
MTGGMISGVLASTAATDAAYVFFKAFDGELKALSSMTPPAVGRLLLNSPNAGGIFKIPAESKVCCCGIWAGARPPPLRPRFGALLNSLWLALRHEWLRDPRFLGAGCV